MTQYVAGVDVGGTTIKMGLFPVGNKPIALWEVASPRGKGNAALYETIRDALYEKLAELKLEKASLKAVGIGLPGPIREDGYVSKLVNLGMGPSYPAKELESRMGIPCAATNDANAAALGEVYCGSAKGTKNAVLLTLGTGVGGGVIVNGKVLCGTHGVGGEIGHFVVNPDETETCNCGNKGCLEQYASATGIVRSAKRLLAHNTEESSLRKYENLTAKDVLDEAKKGDPIALDALDVFGRYLGMAIGHLVLTTDPEKIILGGGVSKAGQILIDTVWKYVYAFTHIAEEHGEIVLAELGNEAGVYGAASLAAELI